jgi:hypothetical protein
VGVVDPAAIDESALRGLGLRGIARPARGRVHLRIGPAAEAALAALRSCGRQIAACGAATTR